jgi:hypothetical protein
LGHRFRYIISAHHTVEISSRLGEKKKLKPKTKALESQRLPKNNPDFGKVGKSFSWEFKKPAGKIQRKKHQIHRENATSHFSNLKKTSNSRKLRWGKIRSLQPV